MAPLRNNKKAHKGAPKRHKSSAVNEFQSHKQKKTMNKVERRNHQRQQLLNKQKEHKQETAVFAGRDGAPKNVVVIPLCNDGDADATIRALHKSIDQEVEVPAEGRGSLRVMVDRFRQQLQYILVPKDRDVFACLDAARAADFVVFVLSSEVEVDERGETILRGVLGQGLSTPFTAVSGLDQTTTSAKERTRVLESLKSFMRFFHPDQDKLTSLDSRQECANLVRALCNSVPKGVHWREERSWMLVEEVQFGSGKGDAETAEETAEEVTLTGVVRGKALNPDRLVQVGDWGAFQIDKITAAPLAKHKKSKGASGETMALDGGEEEGSETVLGTPGEDRDTLEELAPEDATTEADRMHDDDDEDMDDGFDGHSMAATSQKGVLLDNHHYFDEGEDLTQRPRRLPKGTSNYQAAWLLDDDYSDSGDEEMEVFGGANEEDKAEPADGEEGKAGYAATEGGEMTEYAPTEAFIEKDDDQEALQLQEYRAQKRNEAEDDMEFPDEIELHPHTIARERLAKYRGLKSLRSSPWDQDADRVHEPQDWRRLLQIQDYRASCKRALREAGVDRDGNIAPGTRVTIHLVKASALDTARSAYNPRKPVVVTSLLRHEHKQTVANFLIKLSADHPRSIKAKEEMVVQCGARRFVVQPVFSQTGATPNDVHKFCRFLHPGQSAVASFVGPVTWGPVPTLFFQKAKNSTVSLLPGVSRPPPVQLVASGTALPPSTSRVISKRVILTGHPYHINKKIVTIRYMFFNRPDVEWFKALPLWTARGRSGYIKESLGTHGYFKAIFDGRINPQDSIGVSLYKRVWPRKAQPFHGQLEDVAAVKTDDADEDMD